MMKTAQEIAAMRDKFDRVNEEEQDDGEIPAITDALNWVLGHHDDSILTDFLPEE